MLASTLPNRWSSESHVSLLRHGRVATEVGEANVSRLDRRSSRRRDFDREPYTMDEVVRRLSPHGDRAGEWYCTSRQRRMAWRIDMVDAEGLIVRKAVHDMREHTISKAPETCKPETVEQLAKKIIDYNFRFLADFDFKEWD